jgi:Tfp pilus assembly protein PilZ
MLQVSAIVHAGTPAAEWSVHLIDISKGGVAFATTRKLDSGTPFLLVFSFPGDDKENGVEGTVVYCTATNNPSLFRVGATLQMMSDETQERILDFVTLPLADSERSPPSA